MTPESAILVLPASIAGVVLSIMVLRAREQGRSRPVVWRSAVFVVGSLACLAALTFFARAFGRWSVAFSMVVVILTTAWTSLIQALFELPQPGRAPITLSEFKFLRSRWSGVPEFGFLLRRTPLRRLGGSVFLERHSTETVLQTLRENEALHTWAVLLSLAWLSVLGWHGLWLAAAAGVLIHGPLNVYPVLHVRLARARIERLGRRASRSAAMRTESSLAG